MANLFFFCYFFAVSCCFSIVFAGNFFQEVDIAWGNGRGKILNKGQLLTLSLDKTSGSGFQSKAEYLFGRFDMQIKLVPGNSAGTVTTFYLSSQGPNHDEIDFEFLGNASGQPYTLHTNVYAQGKGDREQQFKLPFDPTLDFHTYSIIWNPRHVMFLVDGTIIRDFKNQESKGIPFPSKQPMKMYASLWNADDWATQGGRIKTDWTKAPFVASFRNYNPDACVRSSVGGRCTWAPFAAWFKQDMDSTTYNTMRRWQRRNMIYNYCTDLKRFPQGVPPECKLR